MDVFLFEHFCSVAVTIVCMCTHTHTHTHHHHHHHLYHNHLWQMSTTDPCNSLYLYSILFKCLAFIFEHKKNTPSNLDNDRENDSEPQLSSKLYRLGWHQKTRLANHSFNKLTLSPYDSLKR